MFEESLEQAWRLRFGEDAPVREAAFERLLAHRSVRRFDSRPVSRELMRTLIGAAQSASTSSNLQLWSIISVQDSERRRRMAELCDDQRHVKEAPWFLAFVADQNRVWQAGSQVGEECRGLDYTEFFVMATIDAALAAERLACAAETAGLGVCYIGALRNDAYGVRDFLRLPARTFGLFGMCLGWPSPETVPNIKPRLRPETVWFEETYPDQVEVGEYDERMRAFYESEKMKGDVTWSMRSGRRVDEHHLTGREALASFLRDQLLALR